MQVYFAQVDGHGAPHGFAVKQCTERHMAFEQRVVAVNKSMRLAVCHPYIGRYIAGIVARVAEFGYARLGREPGSWRKKIGSHTVNIHRSAERMQSLEIGRAHV